MQTAPNGDNLHEVSNPVSRKNKKKIINLSSGEFSQRAVMVKVTSAFYVLHQFYDPCWVWKHSFMEIYHEIFPTVIRSLMLIQEGQLSVLLVNHLEG